MASVAEILLLITGDSAGASKAIKEVSGKIGDLSKSATESHGKLAGFFGKLGALALTAGGSMGAGLLAGGVASIKMATTFQQQMELIRTQAGDTTDNMSTLQQQALSLSSQTGQSANDIAQAWFHVASAGITGKAGYQAVEMAAKMADIGNANLVDTTTSLVHIMASGHGGMISAGKAAEWMNAVIGNGDMTMSGFNEAIATGVLPTLNTLGVTLQSSGAALAYLADTGMTTSESMQALGRMALVASAPSAKMLKQLKAMGMSQFELANDMKKPDGIFVALQDLKRHMSAEGMDTNQQNAALKNLFGLYSVKTAANLMGNLDRLKQKYADVGNSMNSLGEDWKKTTQTSAFAMNRVKTAIENVGISIGLKLLPYATKFETWAADKIPQALQVVEQWFAKNKKTIDGVGQTLFNLGKAVLPIVVGAIKTLGGILGWVIKHFDVIGPILAGVIAGFVTFKAVMMAQQAIGSAMSIYRGLVFLLNTDLPLAESLSTLGMDGLGAAIDFATGPIGIAIIAVAALVAVFIFAWTHCKTFRDIVKGALTDVWNFIKATLGFIVDVFRVAFSAIAGIISGAWDIISGIFKFSLGGITEYIQLEIALWTTVFRVFGTVLAAVWKGIGDVLGTVWHAIGGTASSAWNGIVRIVRGAINLVIDGLNMFIRGIDAIRINIPAVGVGPVKTPGMNWNGLNLRTIPTLAHGATVDKATLGIFGEAGKEHVVPALEMTKLMKMAAKAGQESAEGIGNITINHPHSNVDVMQAMEQAKYLEHLRRNGVAGAQEWPVQLETPA